MQTRTTHTEDALAAYVEAALDARADQGLPRTVSDARALAEVRNALEPVKAIA